MSVNIKSNVTKQADRLGKFGGIDAENLTKSRLATLAKKYIPIFADATPKKTGTAAGSIEVKEEIQGNKVTVKMQWGTDYIDDVNRNEGKNQGFADNQFKSIKNRLNYEATQEIGEAYKEDGKKSKLKVK